jgi:hypothetical protein
MLVDIAQGAIAGLQLPINQVLLRIFALQAFTSNDGLRIIQAGTPNEGPWYLELVCNVSATEVTIPACQLDSQDDAFNPGERGARYGANFYYLDGGFIAPFIPLGNFQIRSDASPTTWAQIIAYNQAPYVPARLYETYTRIQTDGLLQLFAGKGGGTPIPPPVTSVFGRIGDILALAGDYTIPQITNLQPTLDQKAALNHTHDATAIVSGIVAPARLGSGSPTNQTFLRGDGIWATGPAGSGATVFSVFGRVGDILAQNNDYAVAQIQGLQPALDGKAATTHTHDASAITTGIIAPARLGTGSIIDSTTFLRGDGTWAAPSLVTSVFGRTGVVVPLADDYDIAKISGLTAALAGKADSPVTIDGSAVVSGLIAPTRLGINTPGAGNFLRGDGSWQAVTSAAIDTTADYTWTGRHVFQSRFGGTSNAYLVNAPAGTELIKVQADEAVGAGGWPNLRLVQNGAARLRFDIDGTGSFLNMMEIRCEATGVLLRSPGKVILQTSTDGSSTFTSYGGSLFSGSGTYWSINATAAGSQAAGYLIGGAGFPALVQCYTANFLNTEQIAGDLISQIPGKRFTFAFNASTRLSAAIDSDPADALIAGIGNTPLLLRENGVLRRVVSDGSKVLSFGLAGTPSATTFLRGDGAWATPPGGGGGGAVSSIGLAADVTVFSVTGSPVTSAGTITLTHIAQAANKIWSGPATGANAIPTFRSLVAADIPNLDAGSITTGTIALARLGTNAAGSTLFLRGDNTWATPPGGASGTITSVALAMPTSVYIVTPASVSSGAASFTVTYTTQSAMQVFAAPAATPGVPSFRLLTVNDIPMLPGSQITSGQVAPARLSSNTPNSSYFLRGDGTWQPVTGTGTVTGPASSMASFDGSGNLMTSGPIMTYDSLAMTIPFRGLFLNEQYAINVKYTSGNAGAVFYAQTGGTWGNGIFLIGPNNGSDGTTTSGIRLVLRCGNGSPADGSANGDFRIEGTTSPAWCNFKGFHGINYYAASTGVPIQPVAPLVVGRYDNNSLLMELHQRGNLSPPITVLGWGLSNLPADRQMFMIDARWTSSVDTSLNSTLRFWINKNVNAGAGVNWQPLLLTATQTLTDTGLNIMRSNGTQQQIILSNGDEVISGYRLLLVPD